MQHLPRFNDPSRASTSHTIPMRPQYLQGLPLRTTTSRPHQERPQAEIIEVFSVQAKDRILCPQSKLNGLDLHLHQQ
jgi:hypothetical protein